MFPQYTDPAKIPRIADMGRGHDACKGNRLRLAKSEPRISLIEFRDGGGVEEGQPMQFGQRVRDLIVRPDNALDAVDQLERTFTAALQRLRGPALAAIENGVGGGHAGGGGRVLAPHDADENTDRGPRVAARERTNFNKSPGFAHLGFPAGWSAMLVWSCIDAADQGLAERGAKSNCRKIRLRVFAFGTRYELNDVGVHDNSSDTATTTRPTSASEIR